MKDEVVQDLYAYQREELIRMLTGLSSGHEHLTVNGEITLWADQIPKVIEKIRQKQHFSRRERQALIAAGFDLDKLYPELA